MLNDRKQSEALRIRHSRQNRRPAREGLPSVWSVGRFFCCVLLLGLLLSCISVGFCMGAAEESGEETRTFVDPVADPDRCSAVLYNNTNGMPTSEANAIAETSDGFIWIGSYSGLVRYDGCSFIHIDSTTGITGVISLYTDSRERLWIGTNDNGVLMMERGGLKKWGLSDGLPSAKICSIGEDGDGWIYVGTAEGLVKVDRELKLTPMEEPELEGIYVEELYQGSDGLVYGIGNSDEIFTLGGGELRQFLGDDQNPVEDVHAILPDPERPGSVYLGAGESSLYHGSMTENLLAAEKTDVAPISKINGLQIIGQRLWLCAGNGIGVLGEDGLHVLDSYPMNNNIGQVMPDYEGNLWFTSTRQGVMKIVLNRFNNLFERYYPPPMVVNSTCLHDGCLYLGTDSGVIVLDEELPVQSIPLTEARTASGKDLEAEDLLSLLAGARIRSIIRDSRDQLWFSTWGEGLLRYERGKVLAFGKEEGLLSNYVRTVYERDDGSLLVAHNGGVAVIDGDRVTERYGKEEGIVNIESLSVAAAKNGDILLGSNGDGIYVINDKGIGRIGYEDGLGSGIVMKIKHDEARDLYWLVTSNSIAYMTPDYRVTTIENFPYSNNFDLYESDEGDMWILSSDGIYVLPTEELLANGPISPIHYSLANGLSSVATSNSFSERTPEGDLYIAGNQGVAKVNINMPIEEVSSLKISIPYLEADGERIYPGADGAYHVPHQVHRLTVYSYVFNYSLSDPSVSYRLEGFDRRPTTVSRKDLGPVVYTNLPGGTYRFVMNVQDSLKHTSKPYSVQIIKEKAFYEQTVFFFACAMATILAFSAGIIWYDRRKTRMMEIKNRKAVEQERLNTELKMASQIQGSVLPHDFPPFPDRTEFDIYASMDPAREVGGDFYDYYLIDDDHLGLVIADVSGKGIPASLFMMISKVIVQSCAMLGQGPANILSKTNEAICSNNQVDMFVTIWVGILEISTGKLTAANAGHEYPALMKNGVFSLFKDKHNFVIGGLEDVRYREYELSLEPGDKLFLYTDGLPEATDANGKMFGKERILQVLNEKASASPRAILNHVTGAVNEFVKDAEQFDDLTMLCLEYKGPQGLPQEKREVSSRPVGDPGTEPR